MKMKTLAMAAMTICIILLLAFPAIGSTDDSSNFTSFGDSPVCYYSGDYQYSLTKDGNAVITGHNKGQEKLIIPSELDGHTVVEIGYQAFYNDHFIRELTIPGTIKTIGEEAFYLADKIRSITIESGVEEIKANAFCYCKAYELSLPDTLISLGDDAFSFNNMNTVQLPNSLQNIGSNPFKVCEKLSTIFVNPEHPTLAVIDGILFSKSDKRLICKP